MNLDKLEIEVAKDFITLVNGAKGFEKKGSASFKAGQNNKSYNWVLLDDILDYVKKSMDFAVTQPLGQDSQGRESVKTVLVHKSGSVISTDWFPLGFKEGDTAQDKGNKETYHRRYSLGSLLGIAVGSDNDGKEDGKTDEDIAKELLEEKNKKDQKTITKHFNKLVTEFGSNEEVYRLLGIDRETFLSDYKITPKTLLEQIEKVFDVYVK